MKKVICFILMVLILISLIPMESFAINSEQEFYQYLDSIATDRANSGNKVASYQTYKKYNLIVYGDPWGDTKPTGIEGHTGPQRRYLGYTLDNKSYTNPYFPPDPGGSGNKPEQFSYVKPSGSSDSWKAIQDTAQKSYMRTATLSGNGATSPSFNVNYIGGESFAKVLSASTWKSEGSIYTNHKVNRTTRYATFTTPPMVGNTIVTGSISTPSNTYYIRKGEDSVSIPVTVKADAEISGSARLEHIKEIKASFQGQSNSKPKLRNITVNSNLIATRANYNVGTHQVKLEGTVSLSTIFNDNDSSNVSKTITLIIEAEGDDPYVNTTVTPDPKDKKFEDKDIDVALTVKGDLNNYTKASNIKEWVFYAREKEAPSALEKKVYTKTLNASTTYKFKIPASKVKGNSFIQNYVVRSRVYFNQKVNGKDYYDAPAETNVRIYKNTPPTGGGEEEVIKPPTAIIDTPKTMMAGEEFIVSGGKSRSNMEGGYIVEYNFHLPNSRGDHLQDNEGRFNAIVGQVWYPVESLGYNDMYLTVHDDNGLTANTESGIMITEPIPVAKISVKGTRKENRKIIIDGYKSYSPQHYPIDSYKSKMKITNLDTGKTEDIYYAGTLDKTLYKEILIKKAGKYEVELYVENIAGYSDTVTEIIEVKPDYQPIAEYSMVTREYRDQYDNNYGIIRINDMSYSPDNDFIKEWIWKITYNSNNSKDSSGYPRFNDNTSFTFKNSDIKIHEEKTITHGGINYKIKRTSIDSIEIKTNQVGYYLVELEVKEGFGQDTILEFITDIDYRRGNTGTKHMLEKTMKIDNREPFVDFEP